MLKYCYEMWNKNSSILEARLREIDLSAVGYKELLGITIECILNHGDYPDYRWDVENITEIDNGDYQGTLLYLIPEKTYQPSEYEYLMTYIGYGSCSCCDTLLSIQYCDDDWTADKQIADFMRLCKDFLTNMTKPYNTGWRSSEHFEHITMED